MSEPGPGLPPDPGDATDPRDVTDPAAVAGPPDAADPAQGAAPAVPLLRRLADHPVPTVLGAVVLAVALGVGAAQLDDDAPAQVAALPSASPTGSAPPSASPSPSPVASPSASPEPSPPPSPVARPELDASCREDAASEAVCRFVLALQTGELDGLTDGERALAQEDTDLPDGPFSVIACDLEGDVTVLCEVQFSDPERIAAGFRLVPANGDYDPATGDLVVRPGERLRYEVVEAVGLRRDAPRTPAPPSPSGPTAAPVTGGLVLGGDELGVTQVGAPYREAVRAVSQVLGPPVADPSAGSACVGAEQLEVEWPRFRLAVSGDRVSGWSSSDPALRTPSGVGVGSTLAELQRVYGERLQRFEATPDSGAGLFGVEGVALGGDLDGSGRVTRLWNGACSPP